LLAHNARHIFPKETSIFRQQTRQREAFSFMPRNQRTVDDVFFRLCHDDRFETENVVIGYHDRIRGNMEMPFASFTPICKGGDVPFHRLRYFRHLTRGVLYDRDSGFDRVFGTATDDVGFGVPPTGTIAAAIKAAAWNLEIVNYNAEQRTQRMKQRHVKSSGPCGGVDAPRGDVCVSGSGCGASGDGGDVRPAPIPVFECLNGGWVPQRPSADGAARTSAGASLRVVSYNVLFDHFTGEAASNSHDGDDGRAAGNEATARRWDRLLVCVEQCGADVVVLQEVTPAFARLLFACPWAAAFSATASPHDLRTVVPYGQLLLSKAPLAAAAEHRFSASKRVVVGEVEAGRGNLLVPCLVSGGSHALRVHRLVT